MVLVVVSNVLGHILVLDPALFDGTRKLSTLSLLKRDLGVLVLEEPRVLLNFQARGLDFEFPDQHPRYLGLSVHNLPIALSVLVKPHRVDIILRSHKHIYCQVLNSKDIYLAAFLLL